VTWWGWTLLLLVALVAATSLVVVAWMSWMLRQTLDEVRAGLLTLRDHTGVLQDRFASLHAATTARFGALERNLAEVAGGAITVRLEQGEHIRTLYARLAEQEKRTLGGGG
jgi:hypothetical protein